MLTCRMSEYLKMRHKVKDCTSADIYQRTCDFKVVRQEFLHQGKKYIICGGSTSENEYLQISKSQQSSSKPKYVVQQQKI